MSSTRVVGRDLLSIAEIEMKTGISRRTLWRWVASGKFPPPAVRVGRIVRWRALDIDQWIQNQTSQNQIR